MHYSLSAISHGVFLLPLIALIPLIPYYWNKRKRGIANPFRLLTFYSFVLYALICWYFIVLPLPSEEWLATIQPAGYNLLPGSYFRDLTAATGFDLMESSTYTQALVSGFALQYWFNVLMLVPLGMYLRYLFRMDAKRTACIAFLTTLLFEVTQLTAVFGLFSKPYRSFDVDDLICNFAGGMIGYVLMGKLTPLAGKIETLTEQAYRKGAYLSVIRRTAALFVDVNIVLGANRLLSLTGIDLLADSRLSPAIFSAQMFLYTALLSIFLGGSTPGKRLLHFNVRHTGGERAGAGRLLLRYMLLYGSMMIYSLIPYLAGRIGMTPEAVDLLSILCHVFAVSMFVYYSIVVWMFPSRDYPWGTLSKTRAALTQTR